MVITATRACSVAAQGTTKAANHAADFIKSTFSRNVPPSTQHTGTPQVGGAQQHGYNPVKQMPAWYPLNTWSMSAIRRDTMPRTWWPLADGTAETAAAVRKTVTVSH